MSEVVVTVGASEALYCAIHAVIGNGDEIILLEPSFDMYEPQVRNTITINCCIVSL